MWFQVVDKGTTYTFEASGPGLTPPFAKGDSVSVHYSIGREVPAISPYEESLSVRTASGELLLALSPSPPAEVTVALGESVCQSVKSDLLSVWSNLDVTVSGQHATVPPGVGVVVGGLLVAQSDPSSQRWLQQVADGFLPRPRVLVAKQ